MNHRHLTSLAAGALLLASATVRAQTPPAAPPAGAADPATTPTQGTPPSVETPKPPPPPPAAPPAAPQPVMNTKWKTSLYGFVELGVMFDTTKSFGDGFQNNTIAHPTNTDVYENKRLQFTPKNSRIGFNFAAPEYEGMKASAQVETDFYGPQPAVSEFNAYGQGLLRMRHFWFKLETPVLDLLAGQFHDLFGWGGGGFYPASVAYLSVSGQLYNRRPQIKLSKVIKSDAVNIEIAASASRPFQRDSVTPDFMGGIKANFNEWKGARAQGDGPASVGAGGIGVSGIYRKFKVNDVPTMAGAPTYLDGKGWGVAANLFAPIVTTTGDDLSNALTLVGEFSYGEGLADMYNGLSGGARMPTPAAPMMGMPALAYTPNIDGGVLTINGGELVPIKWMGALGNVHYHFPFGMGKKMRVSFLGSLIKSDNIVEAHSWVAEPARNTGIWKQRLYFDGNIFYSITPATQIAFSGQWAQQTWANDEKSTHIRGEANFHFFF